MKRLPYSLNLLLCYVLIWSILTMMAGPLARANAALRHVAPIVQTQPPQGGFYPTDGPPGGTVNALLPVPGGVLAATGGGVYHSMNNGDTWVARNNGLTNLAVNAFALVGAVIYAGTLGGVFQSNNNGLNWTPLNVGLTVLAVLALSYIGSTLFAGTSGGGFFALVNGQWTPRNGGLTDLRVNAIKAIGAFIFLGTLGGVFRSENNGNNWTPAIIGLTALAVTTLACIGTTLFAGTQGGGVFRSDNNGGNWLPVSIGLTNQVIRCFFEAGTMLYVGTAGGAFLTVNNGGTWTPLGVTGLTARAVRAILLIGTLLLVGTFGGGIFASTNQGQSWNQKNNGLNAAVVRALVRVTVPNCSSLVAQACEAIYTGTLHGVFCSTDGGRTWRRFSDGLVTPEAMQVTGLVADDTHMYCGSNDGVYRVPINETVWTKTSTGIPVPIITTMTLNVRLPPPPPSTPKVIIVGTNDGVYQSQDRGQNWTPLNNGLTNRQILTITAHEGKLYAGSNGGGVMELVDETWQPRNGGDLTDQKVTTLHATTDNGGTMLAGTEGGGIFLHKLPLPNLAFWQRKRQDDTRQILVFNTPRIVTPQNAEARVSKLPSQGASYTLAGTLGAGALISTNQGETWQSFNNGLANPNVFAFVAGNNLFAATGGGVYLFASLVASVSAASFRANELAAESIVAAFGANLAISTLSSNILPLPFTLGGTRVMVKDSVGTERAAGLFGVSPNQINLLLPPGMANGSAQVTVTTGNGVVSIGMTEVARVAPGLFAANANGQGVASAVVLRVRADGSVGFEPLLRFDAATNRFVPIPIDLGPASDQVYLVLYGTGSRFRSAQTAVTALIGGTNADVLFVGAVDGFAGLDQANILLPRSLAGQGEVDVLLTVDGKAANVVKISVR